MKEKQEKEIQKSWLERLKNESWEAELLVSAIAIYGSFQLFKVVDWSANFFIDNLNPNQYTIGYFISFFGLLAISILTSMFVIHFVLRAYWVGLVGLNSVFPDYSIEDSAYSKIYTKKILSILPKLKDSIQKVDELCSVIFSVAFTFLFIYSYGAVTASVYLLLYNVLSQFISSYILLIPVIIIGGGMLFQSLFVFYANMKRNKENEKIQHFNFKLVKYVSIISFGPLYKNLLQVSMIFGSNFKKKKSLVYLMLVFLFSGAVLSVVKMPQTNILYMMSSVVQNPFDSYKTYAEFYKKDNKETAFLLSPEIQSEKINEETLEIFIPIYNYEGNIRDQVCGKFQEDESKNKFENDKARATFKINCYKKTNLIYIDDKPITVDFLRYNNHSRTNQFGLLCFVDIKDLKKGLHKIKIEKKNSDNENYLEWTIPFYYALK